MRATFIMEQQVGHKTYYQNLRRFVDTDSQIQATWAPITYVQPDGFWEGLTFLPAGVRGTLRGRAQVRNALSQSQSDVNFFFTQVPAMLGGKHIKRCPYVIVTDITPLQYDQMAEHYGHRPDRPGPMKMYKHHVNVTVLRQAASILPFSNWARQSLIHDYGVDPQRIEVIPSGVDINLWTPRPHREAGPLRILFVGGDFERKGGNVLLEAFRTLRPGIAELHIVTRSQLPPEQGVFTYYNMQPNTPELINIFRSSDVFVLPSLAEAFGHVVVEASAVGLPVIVTNIGGMPEIIVDGETGFVIQPGDSIMLSKLLNRLVDDPALRERMSHAARDRVEASFSWQKNSARTMKHLYSAIDNQERLGKAIGNN